MITINPQAADVITINISDADQITLNTAAILLEERNAGTLGGETGAYYLSRANHAGTQAASTITGLATVATSGSYNDLSDKPTISTDAETLDGQDGAYYLSRGNHTGTQAISTVSGLQAALDDKLESVAWGEITGTLSDQTDLQDALNLKLDAADYNDRFLGLFASVFDLEAAHPTASAGDYAQVDFGIGTDVIVYAWDVSDTKWSAVGSSAIANTDALPEGSSNLYHTSQRVRDTPLTGLSTATATPITAADSVLSAAGKLQAQISATAAKADAALAAIDAFNPANLSDAGTLLPNDQLVIWRDGVMLRTTVAALGGDSEPTPTQLMLIPTGATESADGVFQRFEWDGGTLNSDNQGVWEANLPAEDRGAAYRIQMKMPVMVSDDPFVTVRIGDAPSYMATVDNSDGNRVIFDAFYVADNLAAELQLYGMSVLEGEQTYTTIVIAPAPAAGTVITLDVTQTTAVMSWGSESHPLTITSGLLPALSDVLAYSAGFEPPLPPLPLSIKVAGA